MYRYHLGYSKQDARDAAVDMLRRVGVPRPEELSRRYPHELSGGLRQRVAIAMALACGPKLVIADEPTSALDVTIQAQLLELIKELQGDHGLATLLISHDLGIVSKLADTVMVMYAGRPVEYSSVKDLFDRPLHPYTESLLYARPRKGSQESLRPIAGTIPNLLELPSGCTFHPRCFKTQALCTTEAPALKEWRRGQLAACHFPAELKGISLREKYTDATAAAKLAEHGNAPDGKEPLLRVKNLSKQFNLAPLFPDRLMGRLRSLHAVDDVSFVLSTERTLGVVGESGCGKTTLAKLILRLVPADEGEVWYSGRDILRLPSGQVRALRKEIQAVFQDPFSSLPPRMTVRQILSRPLRIHFQMRGTELQDRLAYLLTAVGMGTEHLDRYPHEFSGGQRQRLAISRALASVPKVIIADEPVSSLDVSVQAQVLNLFSELRHNWGFNMIFVSHDLSVIYQISEDVLVMYGGKIMEHGPTAEVFKDPLHPYTKLLIEAALEPDPHTPVAANRLKGEPMTPINPVGGCRFASRCPIAEDMCRDTTPQLEEKRPDRRVACLKV
ncbi:MAG: dipeptide ABC transporter ATP-binding protein [Chloroflexi bacterium]|nr:dipeptide ABC transporter ATP-binding protein [Chloroflexota bacterium]